jgi:hypothetical protein
MKTVFRISLVYSLHVHGALMVLSVVYRGLVGYAG